MKRIVRYAKPRALAALKDYLEAVTFQDEDLIFPLKQGNIAKFRDAGDNGCERSGT